MSADAEASQFKSASGFFLFGQKKGGKLRIAAADAKDQVLDARCRLADSWHRELIVAER